MSTRDAATALRRFGLGARPGEIARIAGDPRGFVLASLANGDAASFVDPDLDPSQVTLTATQVAGQQQQIANQMRRADAVELAADETGLTEDSFPADCPWTLEQLLSPEVLDHDD